VPLQGLNLTSKTSINEIKFLQTKAESILFTTKPISDFSVGVLKPSFVYVGTFSQINNKIQSFYTYIPKWATPVAIPQSRVREGGAEILYEFDSILHAETEILPAFDDFFPNHTNIS
jgi:hypothetical protein